MKKYNSWFYYIFEKKSRKYRRHCSFEQVTNKGSVVKIAMDFKAEARKQWGQDFKNPRENCSNLES